MDFRAQRKKRSLSIVKWVIFLGVGISLGWEEGGKFGGNAEDDSYQGKDESYLLLFFHISETTICEEVPCQFSSLSSKPVLRSRYGWIFELRTKKRSSVTMIENQ